MWHGVINSYTVMVLRPVVYVMDSLPVLFFLVQLILFGIVPYVAPYAKGRSNNEESNDDSTTNYRRMTS